MASYFGLRTVSIQGRSILINGKRVFQRLILDQGFYPDGEWTAPSDEELKKDIERSMAAGFNGARMHQKVFEPRYLYWADKLGYLVRGEFPNWGFDYRIRKITHNYINEWNVKCSSGIKSSGRYSDGVRSTKKPPTKPANCSRSFGRKLQAPLTLHVRF